MVRAQQARSLYVAKGQTDDGCNEQVSRLSRSPPSWTPPPAVIASLLLFSFLASCNTALLLLTQTFFLWTRLR
jgi:hypothetical protein